MNLDLKVAILRTYGNGKQYAAACDAGLSESKMSRIIAGRQEPSAEERAAIAKILGQPAAELFPDRPRAEA